MTSIPRKFVSLLLTLLAVAFLTFMLTSLLPGNPAVALLGQQAITATAIAAVNAELGLTHPLPVRFALWLGHALKGNLGYSFVTSSSVSSELAARLPVTIEIIILAMVISLALAIIAGVVAAQHAGRLLDNVLSGASFVLLAVPTFVMALLLILLLAVHTHVFPASGWVPLTQDPLQNLRYAFLPSLALALPQLPVFMRLLRGDMITVLHEDFIALARSKGLSPARVLLGHAFRLSSFSLVTVAGLQIGFLLGGTVIVENIFALPGIGSLLVQSIYNRDLATVQGVTLFIAAAFVVANFCVDLIYTVIDPRIRRVRTQPA
jgi:peptide/nickel transport system permease protein